MLQINLSKTINAPANTVWQVLLDTPNYPEWNSFITYCESSFKVGAPIIMKVKMFSFLAFTQKETIRVNQQGELLEYGVQLPFGMLTSTRQHVLTQGDSANDCHYQSLFNIQGWLSPLVKLTLGKRLQQGFTDMTQGLVSYAENLQNTKP